MRKAACTLKGGVCMVSLHLLWFKKNKQACSVLICLNVFMTIIHQTLWPKERQHVPRFPCAPTRAQRKPFVLCFIGILFLSLTGYKVKVSEDLSQLKMLEILQIQTQEPVLPHKIIKVCTVHIVLRLLGPSPLFHADTFGEDAAQISTGALLFSTAVWLISIFCYCFHLIFWNVKFCFVASLLPHSIVQSSIGPTLAFLITENSWKTM